MTVYEVETILSAPMGVIGQQQSEIFIGVKEETTEAAQCVTKHYWILETVDFDTQDSLFVAVFHISDLRENLMLFHRFFSGNVDPFRESDHGVL
ncbi:unnamed protein product [Clonostachys solani]|uniref:Uncharacterized protein n=1 Tax=Clonostachys solani TaxID=160281 RepID=A0A9N9YZC8_9HYPO|nr:unnamed protein product [Clonostachys solani]